MQINSLHITTLQQQCSTTLNYSKTSPYYNISVLQHQTTALYIIKLQHQRPTTSNNNIAHHHTTTSVFHNIKQQHRTSPHYSIIAPRPTRPCKSLHHNKALKHIIQQHSHHHTTTSSPQQSNNSMHIAALQHHPHINKACSLLHHNIIPTQLQTTASHQYTTTLAPCNIKPQDSTSLHHNITVLQHQTTACKSPSFHHIKQQHLTSPHYNISA